MHVQTTSLEDTNTLIKRRKTLLAVISDAYRRMATNTSSAYREEQLKKCQNWLDELTEINAKDPLVFNTDLPHTIS